MVIKTSAVAAASAGESRQEAPDRRTAAFSSRRSSAAVTSWPARASAAHIGMPMRPTPINPIRLTPGNYQPKRQENPVDLRGYRLMLQCAHGPIRNT